MVYPNEGEQWAALADGFPSNKTVLPMPLTRWYMDDAFGLKEAEARGANFFEEFEGDHLQFRTSDLTGWLDKYLAG